ncbi:MAG: hypothetical protein KJN64_08935 [Ignavibacteria bacterium]|nr:hypothetical protein [Ignavibacteria bacterium]MBT8383832.1 hypothetical protein [Ignavibacteria bacterium]MBT8392086.1 hypothetical protein [Ignavibacteria bacterium]NNJ54027.1 hypothetical protein [Ignavibacteriaceae bacterium]NNL21013.1 hypothetical protein [Ignavibacteriaceae bacterium]
MSENKLVRNKTLNLNLSDNKTLEEISGTLKEMRKQGFEKVRITIEASINDLLEKNNYSVDLFNKIKETQDLPDWVVYDFIETDGILKNNEFENRLKNEK